MALKAKRFFTVSTTENAVILWDTTLKPLCEQLNEFDDETIGYHSITRKMKGENENRLDIETPSGKQYIIQKHTR